MREEIEAAKTKRFVFDGLRMRAMTPAEEAAEAKALIGDRWADGRSVVFFPSHGKSQDCANTGGRTVFINSQKGSRSGGGSAAGGWTNDNIF